MGTLYVVGIPAGNPEDMTLRALRVLREVSLIVSPDTPRAQKLLAHYGIDTPLAGCAGNEPESDNLGDGDVALLLAEGPSGHSTPAWEWVCAAVERGFAVVSVPGPSAAVTALVISGLPTDAYVSLGFLPRRVAERRQLLASLAVERRTLVAFETSGRLPAALRDAAKTLGDRPLALLPVRDEAGERVWRGTLNEAVAHFEANPLPGEWSLVIGGAVGEAARWPEERVRSELERLLAGGSSRKEAARQVAQVSGWRSREVYGLAACTVS